MKKLIFLITSIIILSNALAIEISAEYPTSIIVKGLENTIPLTLTITNATPGTYNLYTLSDISIKPSQTFEINSDPFVKTFEIKPNENLNMEGNYAFTYVLNHRGVEKYENKFLLRLLPLEEIIEISSGSIDPSSNQISFYIENKEAVEINNIEASFSSILFDITTTINLKPNEKYIIPVQVDKATLEKTPAGVYIINAKFKTNDGIKEVEGNLYLGEKKGITTLEDKTGLLVKTQTITKVNAGNVQESVEIKIEKNFISRLFTSFNIEPTITSRNKTKIEYTWIKTKLQPTESITVKAKTNYFLPFLIIIAIILAIIGYSRFSETKLEIKKSVSPIKTKGGEFALRVTLNLKARKEIANVTLIDKVPTIVKIYKKFSGVKPDKIDAESRRIHWHLGSLEAGEERIVNYIIYSKVGIVGKFSLPRALAVFEKDDNIHEIDSNSVFFMNEQSSE